MGSPCPDDNELVAFAEGSLPADRREVLAQHIDHCALCRSLAAEAVDDDDEDDDGNDGKGDQTLVEAPLRGPTPLKRGESLDRFVVLSRLGSGGLGDVFLAYDPQLDRRVAVKLLRSMGGLLDPEQMHARLGREARALAKVAHPNVVHVYDVGRDGDRVFIAMEYVPGDTLDAWFRAPDRTWSQVRDLMVQAGEGLIAAHAQGIVHRDFKPGNVLIGDDERPRVVDFGLAREPPRSEDARALVASSPLPDGSLTVSGSILGTPAYMAPEQHHPGPVDARADQFAFCVTLFEGLYGQRPFTGRDIESLGRAKQEHTLIDPPEGTRPPAWLRRVVERGLAAEPDDRFASMTELLAALTQDQRQHRRRGTAWGVATMAVLTALGASALVWARRPSAETLAMIEQLEEQAREAAARRRYVFPSMHDPQLPTAYQHLRALEDLPDRSGQADAAAAALRTTFARELTDLGDAYFDREGGRPFALEYYASALVFDPDNDRAAQRAQLPAWALADLQRRATQGEFTPLELAATEPLRVLATDDPQAQVAEVRALLTPDSVLPPTTQAQLAVLLDPPELADPPRVAAATPPAGEPPSPTPPTPSNEPADEATPTPQDPPADSPPVGTSERNHSKSSAPSRPTSASTSDPTTDPRAPADSEAAARETANGRAHLKALRFAEAETAFHRALAAHSNYVPAMRGLSELDFEQSHYRKGLRFARRVVALRPNAAADRILLGDYLFKVLRYQDARPHYERARELGHRDAAGRLDQLRTKLGPSD